MVKKIILIIIAIAAVSAGGYYAYLNVFNNQYVLQYEKKTNPNYDPWKRTYKFVAKNDSVAAEKAVEWLLYQFIFDNPELEKSKYRYQYDNLRLDNVTKDKLVRVPAALIRKTFLEDSSSKYSKFDIRDVDWLMFADKMPFYTYDMTIWLDNPYEDKHLRIIADNDYDAANNAIDTLAYYIGNRWYYENRPVDDVLVANTLTLEFVRSNAWLAWNRLRSHPYCEGINFNRYSVRIRGLVEE
ncbi:hypothetical protein [Prevotella sp. E13-27]|uniref:hypothetical protein n=1 Tax=Prevotella sp. E13-27 TaxID=2938122 RepID=UPI00200B8E6C|nr:hypothetical protein [Prevotella sp. E13-27]MCK8621730.1 hypothetical protein [Prevotella sp. E13-27]